MEKLLTAEEYATYEDYCEVVDALLSVDPDLWPDPDSVVEVPSGRLQYELGSDFDFREFDFAEEDITEEDFLAAGPEGVAEGEEVSERPAPTQKPDALSEKMELFFKKVICAFQGQNQHLGGDFTQQ